MKILVTGGAGFIGSNFLNHFVPKYPHYTFINLDKLTYAANLINLSGIEGSDNYFFEHADIADYNQVNMIYENHQPDLVVNFAAESHVDRSIKGPAEFINANILGTFNLLEASRKYWEGKENRLFHHVSTDEVYGSLGESGKFTEHTRYDPSSPYSASKASSDHLVRSYYRTYNLPVTITNCSNNYGPFQFPEKLIPLIILKALNKEPLPVYGKGENIRDWLYVEDHCEAIWQVINNGKHGETYNIGGNNEKRNIDVVKEICDVVAKYRRESTDIYRELITFVKDRPGHDFRYAIDSNKIKNEIGWKPKETFKTGLNKTVKWYLDNLDWLESVQAGGYIEWMKSNYDI